VSKPRESTVKSAVAIMAAALALYRDGDWNDDYPGGIEVREGDRYSLDMGGAADRALRHRHVKAVLASLDESR